MIPGSRLGPQWGGGLKFYKEIYTEKSLKINTIKCLRWNATPFFIDRLSMLLNQHNILLYFYLNMLHHLMIVDKYHTTVMTILIYSNYFQKKRIKGVDIISNTYLNCLTYVECIMKVKYLNILAMCCFLIDRSCVSIGNGCFLDDPTCVR